MACIAAGPVASAAADTNTMAKIVLIIQDVNRRKRSPVAAWASNTGCRRESSPLNPITNGARTTMSVMKATEISREEAPIVGSSRGPPARRACAPSPAATPPATNRAPSAPKGRVRDLR